MKIASWLIVFLLSISCAYAIGISSPPLENNTLEIIEDQTVIFPIGLQNYAGPDMNVTLVVSGSAHIVNEQETYSLPSGTTYYEILLNVTPPSHARIGDRFGFSVSITSAPSADFQFPLRSGITKSFNVRIIEDTSKFHWSYLISFLGLILAGFVIAYGFIKYFVLGQFSPENTSDKKPKTNKKAVSGKNSTKK